MDYFSFKSETLSHSNTSTAFNRLGREHYLILSIPVEVSASVVHRFCPTLERCRGRLKIVSQVHPLLSETDDWREIKKLKSATLRSSSEHSSSPPIPRDLLEILTNDKEKQRIIVKKQQSRLKAGCNVLERLNQDNHEASTSLEFVKKRLSIVNANWPYLEKKLGRDDQETPSSQKSPKARYLFSMWTLRCQESTPYSYTTVSNGKKQMY
jgi:hypothetical protein